MGSQGGAYLARQGSYLYNLTLDEVQNQLGNLGKPLGSMNLDELLKTVWSTAEAGGSQASGPCSGGGAAAAAADANMQQQLNRQGSLTLSVDLREKTIDEVWRDMQRRNGDGDGGSNDRETRERQATLGEMTLEDFLVKAGVAAESFGGAVEDNAIVSQVDSNVASQQNVHWMQYQLPLVQPPLPQQNQNQQGNVMASFMAGPAVQQQPFPVVAVNNPVLDAGYSEAMVTVSPNSLMGTLSDTQAPGRKRVASGNVVEKTVERRQKRMIKNRESAARSRARKQAYTQELEIKVSRLEEENERLKRQHEIEMVLPSAPPPDPKHQLRRTGSAPL